MMPAPLLSAGLFALWLALARSASAGTLIIAALVAWIVPLLTAKLLPRSHIKRPLVVIRYLLIVGLDVVRSNLQVAWSVITWRRDRSTAKFVIIPLDLRDEVGLAALAMVTSVVPGTVWSELAVDRSALLLHVWNLTEEQDVFVAQFKQRYEKPLQEIFE